MLAPPAGPDHGPLSARFSRRRLLAGGGRGLLALALLGPASAACGSGSPGPDPLEEQLAAARRDAGLASAAAKTAPAAAVPALAEIAAERTRHADALVEEIARAAGRPTPAETGTASPSATATAPTPASPPPTVADVAVALRTSADGAAGLVPALSGYRAGLMGSIAASCTAALQQGLPQRGRPQ